MRLLSCGRWAGLGALVGLAATMALAAAGATATSAGSIEELRAEIQKHISQPRFTGALWSVKIASLDTGELVFEEHATRLMSPASNCKLYVGALALDHFGGDHGISTPLFATTSPDQTGRVVGDLIISGRGDPSWKARPRRSDFWSVFEPFVTVLKSAGVRHITGDVVADTTFFRSPPYGGGWVIEDLNDDYGAEISAITLEQNYVDLRVRPSSIVGRACEFELMQPYSGLVFHNRTVTTPKDGARSIHARRELGGNVVHVFGELPLGGSDEMLDVPVPWPATWFATALREALLRTGIRVDGAARTVRWPDTSPIGQRAVKLGEIASPPLRELVAAFMKPSQNLETDLIFAHLGETLRPSEAPAWRTSEQCAVGALRDFLRRNALPVDEVRFEEGSGLSRNNLASANATLALLTFMSTHREADAFRAALPIAGVDGTLRRRMRDTPAEGNVRAKTGTLRWANSLSGYVTSAAGERLVFSIMLNRSIVPTGASGRDDVDALALMLAQFSGRTGSAQVNSGARKPGT